MAGIKLSQIWGRLKYNQNKVGFDAGGSGAAGNPVWTKLKDTAGVSYYLFVDTSGRLRIHTSEPTANTDGTVVGTQS